jgi:hypothetical protein
MLQTQPVPRERELRDMPPRRFVRLTRRGRIRQAIVVNGVFAALCVAGNLSYPYASLVHLSRFLPPVVVMVLILAVGWITCQTAYATAMESVHREVFLLRNGEAVIASVTKRFASVLNGADTFVIAYEAALPSEMGSGILYGRLALSPADVPRFPVGTALTLLVSRHHPDIHRPYLALRYAMIEGSPNRHGFL